MHGLEVIRATKSTPTARQADRPPHRRARPGQVRVPLPRLHPPPALADGEGRPPRRREGRARRDGGPPAPGRARRALEADGRRGGGGVAGALERGRGQRGAWDATTRQRYDRVVRRQVLRSTDPTRRPLGEMKPRDVTVDRVAAWSHGNEQVLAPSAAKLALIALNQIFRFAVRRGWLGVNPVLQLEPAEKPLWRVGHGRRLGGAHPPSL